MINITDIALEKLIHRNLNSLTFREIVNLLIYAIAEIDDPGWSSMYSEFLSENEKQNAAKWPTTTIVYNDQKKRLDVLSTSSPFIATKNILTMMRRILYLESTKKNYHDKTNQYYRVLNHRLKSIDNIPAKNVSLDQLFINIDKYIRHYVKIYDDPNMIENCLGDSILLILNQ